MPYLKSQFPLPPPVPDANAHYAMFGEPEKPLPADFTLHIDAVTGRKRTLYGFKQEVYEGATALAAPETAGGLGLSAEAGHMVGIFSHNCLVRSTSCLRLHYKLTLEQEYITLVNALIYTAIPIGLLSAFATPYELAYGLKTSTSTHLFVQAELLPKALEAARQVGLPEDRIYILEGKSDGRKTFRDMRETIRQFGTPIIPVKQASKNTLAYLVFSSGTSGLPKGQRCTLQTAL